MVSDSFYDKLRTLDKADPLRLQLATVSPLLYGMHLQDDIVAYPHARYIDRHVVALANLRLYPDGPGPESEVWGRTHEGKGEYTLLGVGFAAATGDEAFEHEELLLIRPGSAVNGDPEAAKNVDRVVFRLAIAVPPRHGKSMIVTEYTPRWFLTRHPDNSVVVATYSQDFAEKWGSSLQELLKYDLEKMPLASDGRPLEPMRSTNANVSFRPGKDRGEINFRGVGGTLTGSGWGLGIIDDPFKGQEDALSEATRKSRKDWYSSVFRKRVTRRKGSPPPLEILMFTRWHEDDLAGAFAYEEDSTTPKPGWCVLRLPALAEANDPLGRPEGASLCPQLVPKSELESQRDESPLWFSCMNQGIPSHTSGNLFSKTREGPDGVLQYYHWHEREGRLLLVGSGRSVSMDDLLWFITVDTATSKRDRADYTVFSLWGYHPDSNTLFLYDRLREKLSSETHRAKLLEFVDRHPRFRSKLMFVGIEDKTFGTTLINELRVEAPGMVIVPIPADEDKYSRAVPYAEAVGTGHVVFPAPTEREWTVVWENEHAAFPNATHDDQVDTGSAAWKKAQAYRTLHHRPEPEEGQEPSHVARGFATIKKQQGHREHDYVALLKLI